MTAHSRRPVTVVVPVYGDLPSLTACVDSLFAHVDTSIDQVLLVNDCGPEADTIEKALLAQIDGHVGFRYERNDRNLGFVGNCNRAALELDTSDNDILLLNSDTITTPGFIEELSAVLHASPTHATVCARSNNATIASLPYQLRDMTVERTIERSQRVHDVLADELPRYSISPVSMGFCFLVRRELIREHGLFDEIFAPGYGEENDFCLRMNAHGYISLIAHRAIVFHVGSLSFVGSRRNALRDAHEAILQGRYPWYARMVQAYLRIDRDPVDAFADALVPADEVSFVLIELDSRSLDDQHLVQTARELVTDSSLRVTVSVPAERRAEAARRLTGAEVMTPDSLKRIWDAVLVDAAWVSAERIEVLNRVALRWVAVCSELSFATDWGRRSRNSARTLSARTVTDFATGIVPLDTSTGHVLASLAASASIELDGRVRAVETEQDRTAALVDAIRAEVDLAQLRARWRHVTTSLVRNTASAAAAPREPIARRAARRLSRIAPRTTGFAVRVVRRVTRR